uniref:protein-tyrosine-phosphatase n=2 Tax=Meloidogyne TaxID=189290 RepID=A0A915N5G2_MELJA
MGNSSLRRSMPSVNNDNEKILNTKEERGDKQQLNTNNRHASFCLDTESSERKVVDGLGALAFGGGNKKENNKSEKIRCTSAHSFSSLTPSSSSAVFTTDFSEHSNAAPALDTKQIEFFLSKREDSLTTITTTLSDEMDNLNESQSKQTNPSTNIHQQRSCSAEHQRIGSTSPLDRRPSMDLNNRKPSNSNRDNNPTESTTTNLHLSSWHSVDETVYCGGIEAALNQNLLCRLNIEYIVDLSGHEDDPALVNTRPRSEYPCLCPKRTAHSRMTMSIKIKDDSHQQMLNRDTRPSINETKAQALEREEIIHYFETLIDLIRKARISQKKVLIHSLRGRNRAPAFVAAYLMHCNRVTRVRAINKITKMMSSNRPGICISDTLQKALMRWQSMLGIRAESSRLDSQQLNKLFEVKRTAWN